MAIKAETSFSLADQLFNAETVATLADALAGAWRKFDKAAYCRVSLAAFPDLELKARITCLVDGLDDQLPQDFDRAVSILEAALPAPLDPSRTDDDFGHFIWSVPAEWVARHGCTEPRLERALSFLREATQRFSVENAIRPFLSAFPGETMAFIRRCAADPNYHVRRLASEGIRPYLPWAPRVRLPVEDIVNVLTRLHADPTRYVTRSVANTLNDLSRDDPELVIATLALWHERSEQDAAELAWMTRHALRTRLKANDAQALALLGYPTDPAFSLAGVTVSDTVAIGDALLWRGTLKSKAPQKLKVFLRVHFLKANGTHAQKAFAVFDADSGVEHIALEKKISFKPMTTRTLFLGTHYVELIVNGKRRAKRAFELVAG